MAGMSGVDTSREAVERLAQRMDAVRLSGLLGDCWDDAATLRALLARAEAAEAERDALRAEWQEIAALLTTEPVEPGSLWPMVQEQAGELEAARLHLSTAVAAVAAEREACARSLEVHAKDARGTGAYGRAAEHEFGAAVIRARGKP
jgi:hypothetical protein